MLKKFMCVAAVTVMLCVHARAADISAKSAVLIDCGTGRVFFEKEADKPRLIASTTKIMTALVVLENCAPDEKVIVGRDALINGSSMYLKEGEELSVEELLYGLMLMSGNDAAMALAIHCGGCESFVKLMNEKAAELGLENTSFSNPHGLDAPDNYSSAGDLARLAAYAMENECFAHICGAKTVTAAGRTMTNHNKLLWQADGILGVKTGFTKAAGRCLVSCAERNGRKLVAVTLDDPDDWRDHRLMYDTVFGAMTAHAAARKDGAAVRVPLASGGSVELRYGAELELWLTDDEWTDMEVRYEVPHFMYSVPKGSAGIAKFYVRGVCVGEVPLYY